MIEALSSWAKSLGVAIVLVSIFEMILPNNKTKKYIRMVLGLFVIFNIIAPLINDKDKLSLASIDIENYTTNETTTVNQASMDDRIQELYEQELERDIKNKIIEQGYKVTSCKVEAKLQTSDNGSNKNSQATSEKGNQNNNEENTITKIKLKVEAKEAEEEQNQTAESKIVTEVQKIKEINTKVSVGENKESEESSQPSDQENEGNRTKQDSDQEKSKNSSQKSSEKITRSDIQNIKKFLIEEYGVSEKCLEIN